MLKKVGLVTGLCLVLLGALPAPTLHALPGKMMGINGTYSEDRFADDAKELGIGWMRVEQWHDQATYDSVDSTLNRLSSRGIQMLPLVNDYTTSWVTPTGKQAWQDQVVFAATHYAKGGTYWQGKSEDLGSPVIEVGNEVYGQWYNWPDQGWLYPGEYAKMIKQTAQAVTQATNGKVSLLASVISDYKDTNDTSADPSGTYHRWAADMKAAVPDIEQYIAGVVVHPYGDIPEIGVGTSTSDHYSHKVLYTVHDQWNVPIYITEEGQKGPAVGFDKQATAAAFYYDELRTIPWLQAVFYYNQKDYQPYNPSGDNGWALIDSTDTRVQAWYAIQSKAPYFKRIPTTESNDGTVIATLAAGQDYSQVTYSVGNKETLLANGSLGDVTVLSGGTLKGKGTVKKTVLQTGATLAPGNSPGCISTGDITIAGEYQAEVNGSNVCTDYDQTKVTGTVTISGSLKPIRGASYTPAAGTSFTIIDNDGSDPISGIFSGQAEGTVFTADGITYRISYKGGDGNDVVLTVQSATPGTPNTGLQLVTQNPLITFLVTVSTSAGLLVLARRFGRL